MKCNSQTIGKIYSSCCNNLLYYVKKNQYQLECPLFTRTADYTFDYEFWQGNIKLLTSLLLFQYVVCVEKTYAVKTGITVQLPNDRQQVSWVLGNDHINAIGVASKRTQWPWASSISKNLTAVTWNGDVSIWVNISWVERNPQNKYSISFSRQGKMRIQ